MRVSLLCLVALAAATQDTQPPVITLDLAEMSAVKYNPTATHVGVGCQKSAAGVHNKFCRAVTGTLAPGYSYVERYSRTCPAGDADIDSCGLPNAHAYDHQDGSLVVTKTIKLMNLDNEKCVADTTDKTKWDCGDEKVARENVINYARRSEYAVEYDASDNAGNDAEKLIFTLILVDHEAPGITPANGLPSTLESCDVDNLYQDTTDVSKWNMQATGIANDNIDGIISDEMQVTLTSPKKKETSATQKEIKDGTALQIDTHQLGTWTITYTSTDHALHFGKGGKSNTNTFSKNVVVDDTTKPKIYCKSGSCAYEPGKVSDAMQKKFAVNAALDTETVELCCHECESQQYLRQDGTEAANHAPACGYFTYDKVNKKCYLLGAGLNLKTTGVVVPAADGEDWATGYPIQCQVQNDHECGTTYTDEGARCIDLRDSFDLTKKTISDLLLLPTSSIADAPIQTKQIGLQTVQYQCTDKKGLSADQATRYINVRDTQAPEITLQAGGHTVETSAGVTPQATIDTYLAGFTCVDKHSCDSSPTTVTSWHLETCDGAATTWNSKKKGTFAIKYTCTDHQGHSTTACRTVVNQDKTAPVITLNNADDGDVVKEDAAPTGSFNDEGATCLDAIDGQINENLKITGDNIKLNRPGTYTIKYECCDSAGICAQALTKTVIIQDKVCPRCVVNEPTGFGQQMSVEAGFPYTEKGATCTDAIGYVDDGNVVQTNLAAEAVGTVDVNVPGKYYITYKAKDGAGNYNDGSEGTISLGGDKTTCTGGNKVDAISVYQREVTVEDTLKPVITLDYNNVPIHISDSSDRGHGDVANPAGDPTKNPYLTAGSMKAIASVSSTLSASFSGALMAQQSAGVNGWMVGAIVSATAGVALLAASRRRTAVATSVPV